MIFSYNGYIISCHFFKRHKNSAGVLFYYSSYSWGGKGGKLFEPGLTGTALHFIFSGFDQQPEKEGGTWFGANKYGRVACLVNISLPQDLTKRGRGIKRTLLLLLKKKDPKRVLFLM